MVFSSVPAFLDAHNWQQEQSSQQQVNQVPPAVLPPLIPATGSNSTGVNKPDSTSERARLAKAPQPETALKCPRCDSTNTKFCYFNNYNLSQPRHFCKTCRRYWTRGGALRNVPVGGGCRRNKRSKARNRSRSPVTIDRQAPSTSDQAIGHSITPTPHLPFLPYIPHLSTYGMAANNGFCFTTETNLPVGGTGTEYQTTSGAVDRGSSVLSSWRMQQSQHFPFLADLGPPPSGAYPLQGEMLATQPAYFQTTAGQVGSKPVDGFVKTEETPQGGLHLSGDFSSGNDNEYWPASSNAWTDLSGFTSSSNSHLL